MEVSRKAAAVPALAAIRRWARLKKYRAEVTYGVYVFTPGEKVVFWLIFTFLFGLATYYLVLLLVRNIMLVGRISWPLLQGAYSTSCSGIRITNIGSQLAQRTSSRTV